MRFEAWTLPWSSTGFKRVIADLPVIQGRGAVRFNDFGEGRIHLPDDYDRLDEIVSSTTGTLIRVYDGDTVVHEFLAERVERQLDSNGVAVVSGPGLEAVFDRAVVYPYDYPTNQFPDHVWGGRNILQNPGFEDNTAEPTLYTLTVTATGGTFTLSDGTDTTSAIAYNASDSTVETRLETDIAAIDDVLVTSTTDGYEIEFVTPAYGVSLSVNTGSLTGGTAELNETQEGSLQPSGWTKSQQVSFGSPVVFGGYDNFEVSSDQSYAGTYSLYVNPADIGLKYAGAQQVVNVEPGGTYQASVRLYTGSSGQTYRLVIRGIDGDLIATTADTSLTASTWTQLSISDVEIPSGKTQVIFRVASTLQTGNPAGFYIDDAQLNEGQSDATVGTIVSQLMDDATTDHTSDTRGTFLTWVDYTGFTTTQDSSSDSWDDSLSFTAYRGMTYGQVFDRLVELGYEWRLTPKTSSDSYAAGADTHNLDWYNPDNAGTDHTTNPSPSILAGTNTVGGPVVQRIPSYTSVLVEGEGVFVEDSDATAITNFGRFEKYHSDQGLASATSAAAAGDALLADEASNRTAVKVTVVRTDTHPVPLVDYTVGDTLYFNLPPVLEKQSRRVRQVDWEYDGHTKYDVTGSRVYVGDQGAWEAVRLLLRRFNKRQTTPASRASGLSGGFGGVPTVFIASSEASERVKTYADYTCDGTNDHTELQAAADVLHASDTNAGGRIVLSRGTFYLSSGQVDLGENVHLMGMGTDTVIRLSDVSSDGITTGSDCTISDMTFEKGVDV